MSEKEKKTDKRKRSDSASKETPLETQKQSKTSEQKETKEKKDDLNQARGGPRVDILYIVPWIGHTEIEPCKLCDSGTSLQYTFEVAWRLHPDGEEQYCSAMCFNHALHLIEREPDWRYDKMTDRNKRVYGMLGLLRREDWSHGSYGPYRLKPNVKEIGGLTMGGPQVPP